jgi:alkanesulfonate monooxygenase SsuD/methylene tetrahydromethanopterin reductase-like flavin-dependent oxidoreductase (luciferase family)
MRFGILASHQYPFDEDLQQRLSELYQLTELAAELGYSSVHTINHFLSNLATPQPISMTAKLLDHTGDMTIRTGILLLPMFHPVHIAEEFATLDQLSQGRVALGVGAGYRDHEFDAFGIDKNKRFRIMDESIRLIRELWSGEPVTFDGEFYTLHDQTIGIRPYTPGGPSICIGAGGRRAVERAARLGDAWLASGNSPNPTYLEKAIATHDAALAKAGKTREGRLYSVGSEMFCAPTREEAIDQSLDYVRREYATYAEYPALAWQRDRFDDLVLNTFVLGSPDDLIERIRRYEALGFTELVFRPFWIGMPIERALSSIKLIAEEVMPAFQSSPSAV